MSKLSCSRKHLQSAKGVAHDQVLNTHLSHVALAATLVDDASMRHWSGIRAKLVNDASSHVGSWYWQRENQEDGLFRSKLALVAI
mmetsp:Transcript_77843/g.252295  ORF Transcript_77843/g.252295 Transcript_77843/m.252295 type:complete len:85 (-) Transcript_77843:231-485(-)